MYYDWHAHGNTKGPTHHHEGIMHVSIHKINTCTARDPSRHDICNPSSIRLSGCVRTDLQLSGFSLWSEQTPVSVVTVFPCVYVPDFVNAYKHTSPRDAWRRMRDGWSRASKHTHTHTPCQLNEDKQWNQTLHAEVLFCHL